MIVQRPLHLSLEKSRLAGYVAAQLSAFTPDAAAGASEVEPYIDPALERLEHCFSRLNVKPFGAAVDLRFNHLHTDQYAMFLYLLSNTIYRMEGSHDLAARVYGLNKMLHAIDVFYEVELPDVFGFQHPVGTVLGRATYGNYLFVYQRCSVGSNMEGRAPVIGEGTVLFGSSAIIGDCTVGANCWLSFGALLMDADVPANSVVFGQSPQHVVKPTRRDVVSHFFLPQ
jgi:serine O-acetyltransferase